MINSEMNYEKIISDSLKLSKNPVISCSWGKDSTALVHMVKQFKPDIEVVYCYQPKFPAKNMHAVKMASEFNIPMHIYPPSKTSYIQKGDFFDVLHFYYVNGKDYICLYNGCVDYKVGEHFLCAVDDLLNVSTVPSYTFKWDCIFQGGKVSDDIHIMDYELKNPIFTFGNGIMSMPLHNWSDEEVLEYLDTNNIPYQKDRYVNNPSGKATGCEIDKLNNDVLPTCYNCINIKNRGEAVHCPKRQDMINYQGKSQKEHEILLDYLTVSMNYLEKK